MPPASDWASFPGASRTSPIHWISPKHSAEWRSRSASGEKVREFAKKLAADSPKRAAFNPADGLSLGEGETVALIYNPDLRMARLRAGVTRATAEHAGRWDDPEFSLDVLKITESVPDPWVVGSAISLTLPVSGRLQAEKARADAASEAELARVAEAEWEVLRDLRLAWLNWSATRMRLGQTEQIVGALDSIIATTSQSGGAGRTAEDRGRAVHYRAGAPAGRARSSEGRVGRAGTADPESHGLVSERPARSSSQPIPRCAKCRPEREPDDSNPTLARLRRRVRCCRATLLREIRKQYPDLVLGPQYESDQDQSRIGFMGAIPIPILNSNKGGIATARAEREVAKAAYETEYERIVGRLAALRARLQGVHARRTRINGTLVPMVDRQMEDARRLRRTRRGGKPRAAGEPGAGSRGENGTDRHPTGSRPRTQREPVPARPRRRPVDQQMTQSTP